MWAHFLCRKLLPLFHGRNVGMQIIHLQNSNTIRLSTKLIVSCVVVLFKHFYVLQQNSLVQLIAVLKLRFSGFDWFLRIDFNDM